MIRVAIVGTAIAVRAGLRALLSEDPSIQVISEGNSLVDVNKKNNSVDVLVWSPALFDNPENMRIDIEGFDFGETTALLVVGSDPSVLKFLISYTIRAWGVIDPEASQSELIAGVHAVNEGLAIADPLWIKQAFTKIDNKMDEDHDLIEPLTEREVEILQLLAVGLTNKQIAARLKISVHTVKFHISSIFNKLGTTNRVETVNLGLKMGLIVL